jgi:Flp pilus assembly protein TadG
MIMRIPSLPRRLRALVRDDCGAAAIELAMVTPVFALILSATVDLGMELYLREQLSDTVSAAAAAAMANASQVGSSGGAALASTLANMAANSHGTNWASSTVTVNDGPTATSSGGSSGSGGAADSCYCPTGTATTLSWGGAQTCGSPCSGGGIAGKFVLVSTSVNYTPLFPRFGLVAAGPLTAATLVQVQ